MAKTITIPKTPRSAFNPARKVSSLLKAQIANLEAVVQRKVGPVTTRKPRNEAQASRYIAELTRQMHPLPSAPATTATPLPAAPLPTTPPVIARKKRSSAERRSIRSR